jgi:hypothetical protein
MACSGQSQTTTLVNALETYLVRRPPLPRVLPAAQCALLRSGRHFEYSKIPYDPGGLSGLEPPRHAWPGVTMVWSSSPWRTSWP